MNFKAQYGDFVKGRAGPSKVKAARKLLSSHTAAPCRRDPGGSADPFLNEADPADPEWSLFCLEHGLGTECAKYIVAETPSASQQGILVWPGTLSEDSCAEGAEDMEESHCPDVDSVLHALGRRPRENHADNHCWWVASSEQTGLSKEVAQAIVFQHLRKQLPPQSLTETSVQAPMGIGTPVIERAVAGLALWYQDGLLVLRKKQQDAIMFFPDKPPRRHNIQSAFWPAKANPDLHVMVCRKQGVNDAQFLNCPRLGPQSAIPAPDTQEQISRGSGHEVSVCSDKVA